MEDKTYNALLANHTKTLNCEFNVLIKHFEYTLKKDEFNGLRLGEYGYLVPKLARASGQPDNLAPENRLNAFYSYCAFEYYMKKDKIFYKSELDRTLNFVTQKLATSYFSLTRAADGYQIGSHEPKIQTEINIRHTIALSMILAMDNNDLDRLDKIKKLLLSDFVQGDNGGWYIWESDKELNYSPDPITSSYALIMLNYFLKYSLNNVEKSELENRITKTIKYLMELFDNKCNLWLIPKLNYYETIQMSVWYFSILNQFIKNTKHHNNALSSLFDSISKEKIQHLENHPFKDDIILRVVFLVLQFRYYFSEKEISYVLEILFDKLNDYKNLGNTTTFVLCNLLSFLESASISNPPSLKNGNLPIIGRLIGSIIYGFVESANG